MAPAQAEAAWCIYVSFLECAEIGQVRVCLRASLYVYAHKYRGVHQKCTRLTYVRQVMCGVGCVNHHWNIICRRYTGRPPCECAH